MLNRQLINCYCYRDRFRTMINVIGDGLGAGLVDHLSKDELRAMDQADRKSGKRKSTLLAQQSGEAEWLNSAL